MQLLFHGLVQLWHYQIYKMKLPLWEVPGCKNQVQLTKQATGPGNRSELILGLVHKSLLHILLLSALLIFNCILINADGMIYRRILQ